MKKCQALTAIFLAVLLALSSAAAFMPSVEYKEAPQIVEKVDESGNVSVGEILDESGEVVANVSAGMITVTPISVVKVIETPAETKPGETKPAETAPVQLTEEEQKIVESLKAVETEIVAEFEKPTESALVQEIAKELNDAPVENIVVSDIFAVTATPEIEEVLKTGATLSVAVVSQNITKKDEKKITIYQKDAKTGKWVKVRFQIDENGVIVLQLKGVGEVVIFRDNEAAPLTAAAAPASPATSGDSKNVPTTQKP